MCRDDRAEPMQYSTSRILTTHTGSLPRPRELTRLYALRAGGEAVDAAAIDRAGREAVRAVVRKQHDAGIDVGNNGEQQRELLLSLSQAAAIGTRRQLGAAVARRCRPLSGLQAHVARAACQQDPGLGAWRLAEGDRRGALSRRSRDRRRMPLFQCGAGRQSGHLR